MDSKRHYIRATALCVFITAFLILFGLVYDHYGRGVHSKYMNYAFLFPFVLCVVPYSFFSLFKNPVRSRFAFNVYNSGVAILTVTSIIRGIVRIAGAANRFEWPMIIAGSALCAAGAVIYIVAAVRRIK